MHSIIALCVGRLERFLAISTNNIATYQHILLHLALILGTVDGLLRHKGILAPKDTIHLVVHQRAACWLSDGTKCLGPSHAKEGASQHAGQKRAYATLPPSPLFLLVHVFSPFWPLAVLYRHPNRSSLSVALTNALARSEATSEALP